MDKQNDKRGTRPSRQAQREIDSQNNIQAGDAFGAMVKARRSKYKMSIRGLAAHAGIHYFQHIDEIERGERPCGRDMAERLALGLAISEGSDEYKDFMHAAFQTMQLAKRAPMAMSYPRPILEAVVSLLQLRNIATKDIVKVDLAAFDHDHTIVDIELSSGTTLQADVKLAEKAG